MNATTRSTVAPKKPPKPMGLSTPSRSPSILPSCTGSDNGEEDSHLETGPSGRERIDSGASVTQNFVNGIDGTAVSDTYSATNIGPQDLGPEDQARTPVQEELQAHEGASQDDRDEELPPLPVPIDSSRTHSPNGSERSGSQSGSRTRPKFLASRCCLPCGNLSNGTQASYRARKAFEIPDELCPSCDKLDLTVDKFVIDQRKVNNRQMRGRPDFWGKRPMGTYQDISQRPRCPLCRLILESMGTNSDCRGSLPDQDATCTIHWTLDGRERVQEGQAITIVKRTRRLAIEWSTKPLNKTYIVLVAPEGKFAADGKINDNDDWEHPRMFLGRLLTAISETSIELIKTWLNLCKENHADECKIPAELSSRADMDLRSSTFTVIDVKNMCLTYLPQEEESDVRYVALSYTWGEETRLSGGHGPAKSNIEQRFKTKEADLPELESKGGIRKVLDGLPLAIQHAIYLTDKLGIPYLWVDSLCIVQDSSDSWNLNAEVMDVVYGNAEFTICAADSGGHEDAGLKALFPSKESKYQRHAHQTVVDYHRKGQQPLKLMLSWPSESYIARSRWNERAWTFQERLLSQRCLIFVAGRMYLQCRSTTMSEDIYSEYKVAGWSVELFGAPAHTLKRLDESPVSVYKNCLGMYTSRKLSYDKDILAAFNGIANIIHSALAPGCPALFGMPASHFDWALLWEPEEWPERREEAKSMQFPSWSWCGWKGKKISYQRALVSGPEINLHEWIAKHTWITYYVRDGRGVLRLIWDPIRHSPNTNIEDRWIGYQHQEEGLPFGSFKNEGDFPEHDFHGRPFRADLPKQGRVDHTGRQFFRKTPKFRRHIKVLKPGRDHSSQSEAAKDYKPLLQFWTWSADFFLGNEAAGEPFGNGKVIGAGLKRFAILDIDGDFVGTCVLSEDWSEVAAANEDRKAQRFIALSDARNFDDSEYGNWSLYTESPREPWQLFNVMMLSFDEGIDPDGEVSVGYRAGLGKVYKSAFPNGMNHGWKEVVLG